MVGKIIGSIVFAIALYVLWQIHHLLLLAFTAVVFATALNRLVQKLQDYHIQRGIAVALSVLTVLAILAGLVALVVTSIAGNFQQFSVQFPRISEQIQEWYGEVRRFLPGQLLNEIESLTDIFQQLPTSGSGWFGRVFDIFRSSIQVLLQLLLVTVVTIMFLSNPASYRRVFIVLFPAFYRRRIDEILSQCEEAIFGWFIGILFNMTVISVLSGVGLWLLGVPLPLANAILAGLLTYIPNLGPTLSVIPPAVLGFTVTPWKTLAVVVLYIAIQQIESNILTPLVMKQQVSLLPAITLLSQLAFATFFGLIGLFLALPIVVVLQVWLRELLVKDILNNWNRAKKATS
ncbi:MAG: AI-2E family transporter [Cyanophyceae cyanobacterium]